MFMSRQCILEFSPVFSAALLLCALFLEDMADPLSVAASIAGVISLANVVFERLMRFARAAKDADHDTRALAQEVNLLGGALNSLSRLARRFENESFDKRFCIHHIESCNTTLTQTDNMLKKVEGDAVRKALIWRLTCARTKN